MAARSTAVVAAMTVGFVVTHLMWDRGFDTASDVPLKQLTGCIGWRQAAGCSPKATRIATQDLGCSQTVAPNQSGYCQCTHAVHVAAVGCRNPAFKCAHVCRDINDYMSLPPAQWRRIRVRDHEGHGEETWWSVPRGYRNALHNLGVLLRTTLGLIPPAQIFIVLKSPRSGSTFLSSLLQSDKRLHLLFEPTLEEARRHIQMCRFPLICGVSLNDFLKSRQRHRQITEMIRQHNAVVVMQLRANVVQKAISSERLFGPANLTPAATANRVRKVALAALETIKGFVLASEQLDKPSLWMWYEDLVRDCVGTVKLLYTALGQMPPTPNGCAGAAFKHRPIPLELRQQLVQERALSEMARDPYEYNLSINTSAMLRGFTEQVAMDGNGLTFHHWR